MKKFFVLIMSVIYPLFSTADVCERRPGQIVCGKGAVADLVGNGMVTINGTNLTGTTLVNGLLNAEAANFDILSVNGRLNVRNCVVKSNVKVRGLLEADNTKFEGEIEVYSSTIKFINSNVSGNIRVGNSTNNNQTLYLSNHSTVNGNVIFDSGNGEVVVSGASVVLGRVIGGRLTRV